MQLAALFLLLCLAPALGRHVHQHNNTRSKRSAMNPIMYPNSVWDKREPIFYSSFGFGFQAIQAIKAAIKIYEENTCLKFQEGERDDDAYLLFQRSSSQLGKSDMGKSSKSGPQNVVLAQKPSIPSIRHVAHEIGHSLGLYHTHQRSDRDNHVVYHESAISARFSNEKHNYDKNERGADENYGVEYDFGSMMHYSAVMFSTGGRKVLTSIDPLYQDAIGMNNYGPAQSDLMILNHHYKCFDNCAGQQTPCRHGGFANPNNCDVCVCPRGFTGDYCSERPIGNAPGACGETIEISGDDWTNVKKTVGTNDWSDTHPLMECFFHLKATPGHRLEIKFNKVGIAQYRGYCFIEESVELKVKNFHLGGYHFCDLFNPPTEHFVTEGDIAALIVQSTYAHQMFDVDVRQVYIG